MPFQRGEKLGGIAQVSACGCQSRWWAIPTFSQQLQHAGVTAEDRVQPGLEDVAVAVAPRRQLAAQNRPLLEHHGAATLVGEEVRAAARPAGPPPTISVSTGRAAPSPNVPGSRTPLFRRKRSQPRFMAAQLEISPDTNIRELVADLLIAEDVLSQFGLHCAGCGVNKYETIAQGAKAHGLRVEPIVAALAQASPLAACRRS